MRFRVVTYNIHRAIGVDRRFKPERIVEILEHHGPDLVLLQEVDEGVPRSRELDLAQEMAEALKFPYYAVGHNVSLRKGRYGNATLSRFPILRERNIDLTIGNKKRRGCQHTTLWIEDNGDLRRREPMSQREAKELAEEKGGRQLEVFNLHLGLSARERERQVGLLVRSPELKDLPPEVPCMVGGDFNDWRSLLRPIFVEVFSFRCATDRRGGRRALSTYPSFSPQGGLDRIYYRGGLHLLSSRGCRLAVSRVASDHLPVIADFDLP